MVDDELPKLCEVCAEDLDPQHNAVCAFCHRYFHLTWDTRLELKDCGRFDIDDNTLALYFTCKVCVAQLPQGASGATAQKAPGPDLGSDFQGAPER